MAQVVIEGYDKAQFEQMLQERDGAQIQKLLAKMKEEEAALSDRIIGNARQAILGASDISFEQAVTNEVEKERTKWEQSLPKEIRKVLESNSAAQAKANSGDELITRQSLEENWTIFKNEKDEIASERYDVPIHQFMQDIDAASGVSAARRSNLNAIFAMVASNPFAPYITMGSSTGIGQIDMGVLTGIQFVSDQGTASSSGKTPSGSARKAGQVVTGTVGGLAEENVVIRRYYCNFLISNAALEQVQGIRNAAIRAITRSFVKSVGDAIHTALAGLGAGTSDTEVRSVKTAVEGKVPLKAATPGIIGDLLAGPFADSLIRGDCAWVMRQEMWKPLIEAELGAGFDPTMQIPVVYGFPWHPTSLLPALAKDSRVGYFGNYREAIAAAVGPNMRIEINRVTHPGYTYFHAEGAIGVTAHNRSNTLATLAATA